MSAVFLPRMKKIVWKDVPNPNKCSWAKGLDFKKVKNNIKPEQHASKHSFICSLLLDSFAWLFTESVL